MIDALRTPALNPRIQSMKMKTNRTHHPRSQNSGPPEIVESFTTDTKVQKREIFGRRIRWFGMIGKIQSGPSSDFSYPTCQDNCKILS